MCHGQSINSFRPPWQTRQNLTLTPFEAIIRTFLARNMKKAASELKYNTDLRAPITTAVNDKPKARVHSREWQKIMNGDPVEINPSVGYGYKIMSVDEWSARWKQNEDFPECLNCGSKNTKEHHFTQVRVCCFSPVAYRFHEERMQVSMEQQST